MLALWSGLVAGGLHAIGGPDHLAALGPLALRRPQQSTRAGASWGLGHGAGLLLLALLVMVARLALPLDTISWGAELAVGVWLVAVGLFAFRARPVHETRTHEVPPQQRAAFLVGLLHGATGAGHVIGVLPGLGLTRSDAGFYLCGYALAAVVAMSLVGRVLGGVALRAGPVGLVSLRRACAALALIVGVFWTGQALTLVP